MDAEARDLFRRVLMADVEDSDRRRRARTLVRRWSNGTMRGRFTFGSLDLTDQILALLNINGGEHQHLPTNEAASKFLGQGHRATRRIGEELDRLGGFAAMQAVADFLRERYLGYAAVRELEQAWDGIGEWQS